MKAHAEYLWFTTPQRRGLVNITRDLGSIVARSGVGDGLCLVSAMHITAGLWVHRLSDPDRPAKPPLGAR